MGTRSHTPSNTATTITFGARPTTARAPKRPVPGGESGWSGDVRNANIAPGSTSSGFFGLLFAAAIGSP
ncbi:hypothetical protein ABMX48_26155 [Streptomyces cavourensis]